MAHFVIVGIGAAGLSAAETIRQHQPSAEITIIAEDLHGYYSRPGLAYLLTHEVPEAQLFPFSDDRWQGLQVRRLRDRAVRLDPDSHQVTLRDGTVLTYDSLLLATGSRAIMPDLPGQDLRGVTGLDTMDDAQKILRLARRAKSAVVIGGGITALEMVEGLRAQRTHVHYMMRGDRFWRSVLDETESRLIERRLTDEGVTIHYHAQAHQILGKRDWRGRHRAAGVETQDGKTIPCQMVGIAIGVRPRLDLTAGTGIETDRGILVNERLETSVPGIYAAGDVAQVYDPITGRTQLDVLWPVAVAQGRVAGANMAAVPTTYRRGVPLNVTRLAGLLVTLVGAVGTRGTPDPDLLTISRGDSEVWRGIPNVLVVYDQHESNRQRLMLKNNRLVGAVIIGDQSFSSIIHRLIQDQIDVDPYLAELQAAHVDLATVLQHIQADLQMDMSRKR